MSLTKEWYKLFSTVLAGSSLPPNFVYVWAETLKDQDEYTNIALWNILISLAVRKPFNKFWQEVAIKAMTERERIKVKKSNKITLGTTLANIYALTKNTMLRGKL